MEMASTAMQLKQDLAEFRSELSKKLDSVLEHVSRIEVEFGEVNKNDIESLKVVISAEKASAAALRADLVSLTERVSECGEKLDAAASTTSDRITALETKLDTWRAWSRPWLPRSTWWRWCVVGSCMHAIVLVSYAYTPDPFWGGGSEAGYGSHCG